MTELLKKLLILKDRDIVITENINFRDLYFTKKIFLIDGTIKCNEPITDEYLIHKHEIYTGRPEKVYSNNWQTYRGCEYVHLTYNILNIVIFEGDSCDGYPTKIRWKAKFELYLSEIHLFKDSINHEFEKEIDRQFIIEEENRILQRKQEIKKKLLSI